jgi:hypothetical protein
MKIGWSLRLAAAAWLVLSLPAPILLFGQEGSAAQSQPAAAGPENPVLAASTELPDSPGAVQSQNTTSTPAANNQQSSPQTNPAPQPQQPETQQSQTPNPQQQQQTGSQPAQPPVGTAAARTANPSGVAASEPAGSAIAPAKQRRTRIILISVAAIVGAAAAVGIVAGLSSASPSRPPGAH